MGVFLMREDAGESTLADLATLGSLFDRYQSRLLEMLRRRIDPALSARLDADDLLSDTFVLAKQKWADFKSHGTMREYPWLYRMALDCLIEAWRKNTRARRNIDAQVPWPSHSSIQLGLSLVHHDDGPATEAVKHELEERVQRTLQMLKEKDREVLWMRHYDQLTFAEIGEVLELTENTATVRYVRAVRRLKDLWQKLYSD